MTTTATVRAGDKAVKIGKIGHGTMMMTWRAQPVSDEQAFEALKASLDSVPPDTKMLIVSGEFYGFEPPEANLELLARFFETHPTYADKAFLSVKGARNLDTQITLREKFTASVDNVLAKLRGTKKLDLFEPCRLDDVHSIEETVEALKELKDKGKFEFIGLSEVNAKTLEKAHAIYPIAIAEIEVSPWSYDEDVKAVIGKADELGIIVAAYSPLGRGYLAGSFKSASELDDIRKHLTRFQDENAAHNQAIVDEIRRIAVRKNISSAQLCIAWVASLGPHVVPIPGSSNKGRTLENQAAISVSVSKEEDEEIQSVVTSIGVKGSRYVDGVDYELMR